MTMPLSIRPLLAALVGLFVALAGCDQPLAGETPGPGATSDEEPRFEAAGTAGEDTDPLEDVRADLDRNYTALVPTSDVAASSVRSAGDIGGFFKNLDDGTTFKSADGYTTFVRSAANAPTGTLTVGFSGNLPGVIRNVVVNYRAQQGTGRGTIRVELLNGTTVVGTGETHKLGEPWANFADVFTDTNIQSVSNLRVKISLNNESTTGGVRLTQLWINVETGTPPQNQPDAGTNPIVDAGTPAKDAGTPVKDAGTPVVDAGTPVRDAGTPVVEPLIPPPNTKVAFTGDTTTSTDFRNVLKVVKAEAADMLVVNGDGEYTTATNRGATWWGVVNAELGATFPVFMAVGNHDASGWTSYATVQSQRFSALGITLDEPSLADTKFAFAYKGISFAFVGQDGNAAYPGFISTRFANDAHVWKICGWHKNQANLQIGGKGNEMGYPVYEACRNAGAIISTAHEHSYERTKTLNNFTNQTVDATCSSATSLCVDKGRSFAFVSGLGGNDIRDQQRCLPTSPPYGCNGEWAFIYTSNQAAKFGALFLVFHVDGNPKKGRGYFKTVDGQVLDNFTFTTQ